MSQLPPLSAVYPSTTTSFDQQLGRAKKALDFDRENIVLGTEAFTTLFNVASVAASVTNSTIQAYCPLPSRMKISKIAVYASAISSAGVCISTFNIVLGPGTYAQGAIPGNDNSSVPNVGYNAQGQPAGSGGTGTGAQTYAPGGGGFPSNPAVNGQAMFAADVTFNTANFPAVGATLGTSLPQILIPSSPDAVWPNSGLLTLRCSTPTGAGTITNLIITAITEPLPLDATYPDQVNQGATPLPGISY